MRISVWLMAALLPCLALANDRFAAGGSVRQSEAVSGDLISFGGNVDLAAAVSGDAILGGGDVRIRDRIEKDLFAAGGNVRVEAAVGRNARLAGGNVDVTAQGRIEGDLSAAGGTVEIRGPVGGNVQAAGGNVLVDSEVGGDVKVGAGSLRLGPNARIAGRVVYRGPGNLERDPAAQVAGGVERKSARLESHDGERRLRWFGGWFWTLGLVALAALIAGAFPTASRRLGETLRGEPGTTFFIGFVALVCVPIAAILISITIIGLPVGIVMLMLYAVLLIVGYAATAVTIGDTALARLRAQDAARLGWRVGAAMLAMLVLALLGRIPYIGGIVIFAALLAGIGAIVVTNWPRPAAHA